MANAICPWEGGCRGQTSQLHIRSPVGPSQVGLSPYCTFYSLLFLPPPKSNHPLPRTAAVSVFRSSGSQGSQTRHTACFCSQWPVQGCCALLCEASTGASAWGLLPWSPLALIFLHCPSNVPQAALGFLSPSMREQTGSQMPTWSGARLYCLFPVLDSIPRHRPHPVPFAGSPCQTL